jgi:hypothetical protein
MVGRWKNSSPVDLGGELDRVGLAEDGFRPKGERDEVTLVEEKARWKRRGAFKGCSSKRFSAILVSPDSAVILEGISEVL